MESLSYWIGIVGTAAFAVTAVLALCPQGVNLFTACLIGIITAAGGGTLRDVILDVPVFWAADLSYMWVALGASLVAFRANTLFTQKEIYKLLLYTDGAGVALFAIQATHKVWNLHFGLPLGPVILGVVTAIGGGLIRDALAGRQNLLMDRELYAMPVTFGCALYVSLLEFLPRYQAVSGIVCGLGIFGLRAAAIYWKLSVPQWLTTKVTK